MTVTQVQPEAVVEAVAEAQVERNVKDVTPARPFAELIIAEFKAAKVAEAEAKAAKVKAEAALRALLGDSDALVIDGVERVQVQHRVNTNYLADVLVNGFPEAAEAARKVTPYTILKVV